MTKILVVDDEAEVADFLCNFFRRFKIDSEKALNGKDAIEMFSRIKPDWVCLDIKMPEISGLEVLKKIKEINPDVGAIMITGRDDKESQVKAKELGAVDYIVKPLDLEDLHKKIENYILK